MNTKDAFEMLLESCYFPYRIDKMEGVDRFHSKINTFNSKRFRLSHCYASEGFRGRFVTRSDSANYVLHFMVQGALQVQLGKRSEVVRAGELVIFSDEYLVRTQQIGSAQALALCIPSSALYTDAKSINPSIHKAVSFNAGLPAILFGTLKAASKQYPSIDESSQASLDRIVVDLVQTLFTDQIRRAQGVAATDLNYGLALDYISGNLADRSLSINSAAAELGLSRGRLCASFAVHDSSFEQTVIRLRLERAREIIRSHKDVKMSTIADSVGFATAAHFSRSFSQKFGMSPIVYRHGLLNNNVSQPRVPSDVSLI